MKTNQLLYLMAAGLFLQTPVWAQDCDVDDDDEEIEVCIEETPEQREANLKRSQAELEALQNAARSCTHMAWEVFDTESGQTHIYPISDADRETIRHILLTRAHAVCYAEPDEMEAPDKFISLLIWNDGGGVSVEWPIGRDSLTDGQGYQEGQMFSIPDADYETIDKIVPWGEIYPDSSGNQE